jgi:N-acetylmuramoyl-L-alanine amidase
MAYHAGGNRYNPAALNALGTAYPNNSAIGIELCHQDWSGRFEKETLDAARELCYELKEKYGVSHNSLFRHFDITGKDCPRYFVKNEDAWFDFKDSVLFW